MVRTVASSGIFLENFQEISQNFPKTYPFPESFSKLSQKFLKTCSKVVKTFSVLKTCSHSSKLSQNFLISRNFFLVVISRKRTRDPSRYRSHQLHSIFLPVWAQFLLCFGTIVCAPFIFATWVSKVILLRLQQYLVGRCWTKNNVVYSRLTVQLLYRPHCLAPGSVYQWLEQNVLSRTDIATQ